MSKKSSKTLTPKQQRRIYDLYQKHTYRSLADKFGTSHQSIKRTIALIEAKIQSGEIDEEEESSEEIVINEEISDDPLDFLRAKIIDVRRDQARARKMNSAHSLSSLLKMERDLYDEYMRIKQEREGIDMLTDPEDAFLIIEQAVPNLPPVFQERIFDILLEEMGEFRVAAFLVDFVGREKALKLIEGAT